ncbi:MAG: hypothetical protein HYV28_16650 [Ignavibacteriales bacterium]|nr:hypothetical protein [Ignavibacteriales bacterium]
MKKFLLPVTIILISVLGFISCKRSDPKIFTPNNPFANQKLRPDRREHLVSPDGKSYTKYVDGKPVPARFTKAQARETWAKFWNTKIIARMDTAYLKHEIDSLYTADTLLKYFGPGVHSFFLKVFVTQQQYIMYSYRPYPQLDPEELVYNIKFDLYNSMLHVALHGLTGIFSGKP